MSDNWAVNMKVLNATSDQNAIVTGGGYYFGIRITSDATNAGRALVYDALTATGTIIDDVKVAAALATSQGGQFTHGVRFNTGLTVDMTTISSFTIWYIPTGA